MSPRLKTAYVLVIAMSVSNASGFQTTYEEFTSDFVQTTEFPATVPYFESTVFVTSSSNELENVNFDDVFNPANTNNFDNYTTEETSGEQ